MPSGENKYMTTIEVKKLLKEKGKTWSAFRDFMVGQTVGGTPNNPDYYECDVMKFLSMKKGQKLKVEEWD